jgi:hypothetical protein
VLDAVEEALNEVALPVEPAREGKALLAVGARRDVGLGILAGSGFSDGVAVVALIGKQRGALGHRIKQVFGFLAVVDLTASQAQGDGTTVSVNEGMDLAREAALGKPKPRSSDRPFARRTVLVDADAGGIDHHDLNYIALSGVIDACGRAGDKPTPPMNLLGDFGGGGMMLAFGMVAALLSGKQLATPMPSLKPCRQLA